MKNLLETVETIIFAAGAPITKALILEGLPDSVSRKNLNDVLAKLEEKYSGDSGILLLTFNDKVQFSSNPKYGEIAAEILTPLKEKELTRVLLEVLAIVAYKQPVTKLDIEEIRGVSSEYAITVLSKVNLIKPVGHKDTIGRPLLYGTTDEFLKKFELHSIDDLPDYAEIMSRVDAMYDPRLRGEGLYRDQMEVEDSQDDKSKKDIILEQTELRQQREIEAQRKKEQLAEIDKRLKVVTDFIDQSEIPDFLSADEALNVIEVDQ